MSNPVDPVLYDVAEQQRKEAAAARRTQDIEQLAELMLADAASKYYLWHPDNIREAMSEMDDMEAEQLGIYCLQAMQRGYADELTNQAAASFVAQRILHYMRGCALREAERIIDHS